MSRVTDSTFPLADEANAGGPSTRGASTPGLLLVFSGGKPLMEILPLQAKPIEIGRGSFSSSGIEDATMSRRHATVAYRDGRFEVCDLSSRNGSALEGQPFSDRVSCNTQRVLRLGQSLFLLCHEVEPYRSLGIKVQDGRVEGPILQRALRSAARFAEHSRTLFILGESGAGKESMAQAFHCAGPQKNGPFVAVNCATIPEGIAERLLFGAHKGAYSGASSDSEGYILAAHGGTLFLDEVAELGGPVQAKLLRTLETQEFTPLGMTRPRRVDVRICSATHKDLRGMVAAGIFRSDLYFRLGMPQATVPPLRQRLEEIPWLITQTVAKVSPELKVSAPLVEACLLRSWPGNVRELLAELNTAAVVALAAGADSISVSHLRAGAGAALVATVPPTRASERGGDEGGPMEYAPTPPSEQAAEPKHSPPSRTQLLVALLEANGNLSEAARTLGLHRTQLRRYLNLCDIDLSTIRGMNKK